MASGSGATGCPPQPARPNTSRRAGRSAAAPRRAALETRRIVGETSSSSIGADVAGYRHGDDEHAGIAPGAMSFTVPSSPAPDRGRRSPGSCSVSPAFTGLYTVTHWSPERMLRRPSTVVLTGHRHLQVVLLSTAIAAPPRLSLRPGHRRLCRQRSEHLLETRPALWKVRAWSPMRVHSSSRARPARSCSPARGAALTSVSAPLSTACPCPPVTRRGRRDPGPGLAA
jgi:hypothetical protein